MPVSFCVREERRARNLTLPSSGRSKGRFAPFGSPLMSNVRPHKTYRLRHSAEGLLLRVAARARTCTHDSGRKSPARGSTVVANRHCAPNLARALQVSLLGSVVHGRAWFTRRCRRARTFVQPHRRTVLGGPRLFLPQASSLVFAEADSCHAYCRAAKVLHGNVPGHQRVA